LKRIFIAVRVDAGPGLLTMISSLKSLLAGESIKWSVPVNIHLTLAFLGDTPESRISTLPAVLQDACKGTGEFDFYLSGCGVFKNYRDPKVIWAGITQSGSLEKLHERIRAGLAGAGFITEERPFRPHLTLGRIRSLKDPGNLKSTVERYSGTSIGKVHVNEVILFESILSQTGAKYISLGKFALR